MRLKLMTNITVNKVLEDKVLEDKAHTNKQSGHDDRQPLMARLVKLVIAFGIPLFLLSVPTSQLPFDDLSIIQHRLLAIFVNPMCIYTVLLYLKKQQ